MRNLAPSLRRHRVGGVHHRQSRKRHPSSLPPSRECDQLTQQAVDDPALAHFLPCHARKSPGRVADPITIRPLSVAICNHQTQGRPIRPEQIALSFPERTRYPELPGAIPSGRQDAVPTQVPTLILRAPVKLQSLAQVAGCQQGDLCRCRVQRLRFAPFPGHTGFGFLFRVGIWSARTVRPGGLNCPTGSSRKIGQHSLQRLDDPGKPLRVVDL